MKRKIVISSIERTGICAALLSYGMAELASSINSRYFDADPANDGPEVTVLSVEPEGWDA
jgi:hypothetical protein